MIVLCLEGCHGSGKSTILKEFQKRGFNVLDEAFLDMPSFELHPQTLTMEFVWVAHWFTRILRLHTECPPSKRDSMVYIADRSPYSACFYARTGGELLGPVIQKQIKELTSNGIYIFAALLNVEKKLLWKRISDRLAREPYRKKFNEGSREWMEKTYKFYESQTWNLIVPICREDISPKIIVDCLIKNLQSALGTTHSKDEEESDIIEDSKSSVLPEFSKILLDDIEVRGLPVLQDALRNDLPTDFEVADQWPECADRVNHIRDQGNCGSCWAHGAAEALTDRFCINSEAAVNEDLSVEYIVSCDKTNMGCDGGNLGLAWMYLKNQGTVPDACFPYADETYNDGDVPACPSTCDDGSALTHYQVSSYHGVSGVDNIMTQLYENGSLELAFYVFKKCLLIILFSVS
ncbi:hypothetical protein ADUPG1_000039 [Aduncisulcus paluster]|uniref:Peptidase C1A papain C-terminal domain-containing protein n=1 Tax=Aduncisulcus paluster TaxID=2918883 RepID=A0ABQ5K4B6_9EUKA|nr:hypothetical protein ADUPG1_000039 [Aduncisulcus paluster]